MGKNEEKKDVGKDQWHFDDEKRDEKKKEEREEKPNAMHHKGKETEEKKEEKKDVGKERRNDSAQPSPQHEGATKEHNAWREYEQKLEARTAEEESQTSD